MKPSTSWSTTELVRPPLRVSPAAPSTAVVALLSSTWLLTTSQVLPLATLPIIVSLISRENCDCQWIVLYRQIGYRHWYREHLGWRPHPIRGDLHQCQHW